MYVFLRFPDFRYKAVTLSYDDGVIFDRKLIKILDEYGLKCTFNINSELYSSDKIRLSEAEATELYSDSQHEIAIHGAKHLSLAEVSPEVATSDILIDRQNLERQFGRIVKGMAYANGSYNDNVVEILKNCGVHY